MKGKLILENGMSFDGKIFGELGESGGGTFLCKQFRQGRASHVIHQQ